MKTYYCIDMSGSISSEQIQSAVRYIKDHISNGDKILVFDIRARWLDSLDQIRKNSLPKLGGGTDPTECLRMVEEDAKGELHQKILLSDGFMPTDMLWKFDTFIDITR